MALRADGTKLQTEARIGIAHSIGRVLAYEARSEANGSSAASISGAPQRDLRGGAARGSAIGGLAVGWRHFETCLPGTSRWTYCSSRSTMMQTLLPCRRRNGRCGRVLQALLGYKPERVPRGGDSVPDLDRYIAAQDQPQVGFTTALAEIRAGGKQGHWIWYIFPQLSGLGRSGLSYRYAIADPAEARAYLQHPELRSRLLAITSAVADQARRARRLTGVMGSST